MTPVTMTAKDLLAQYATVGHPNAQIMVGSTWYSIITVNTDLRDSATPVFIDIEGVGRQTMKPTDKVTVRQL